MTKFLLLTTCALITIACGTPDAPLEPHPQVGSAPGAITKLGTVEVKSGLSPEQINRVVARRLPRIHACYTQALKKNADRGGKIILTWQVAPDGRAGDIGVLSSSVLDADMEGCVKHALRKLDHPQPADGKKAAITCPITFSLHD